MFPTPLAPPSPSPTPPCLPLVQALGLQHPGLLSAGLTALVALLTLTAITAAVIVPLQLLRARRRRHTNRLASICTSFLRSTRDRCSLHLSLWAFSWSVRCSRGGSSNVDPASAAGAGSAPA